MIASEEEERTSTGRNERGHSNEDECRHAMDAGCDDGRMTYEEAARVRAKEKQRERNKNEGVPGLQTHIF